MKRVPCYCCFQVTFRTSRAKHEGLKDIENLKTKCKKYKLKNQTAVRQASKRMYTNSLIETVSIISSDPLAGSRCTFEFPRRINLSGPSLYCT